MAITLNGTTIPQPQADGVKEELLQIYHDRMRVNGSLQRNFFGVKKQATLKWDALSQSDYSTLINMFTTGHTVVYSNPLGWTFTGLPMHADGEYIPGNSFLRPLTVTIREV